MRLTETDKRNRVHCQTDLWYLTDVILEAYNGNKFSAVPHKSMCEFYVEKDSHNHKTFQSFAQSYMGSHDRIMLVPRQARKSGIKIIDNVQWIINWPEIRIMTCCATNDLATAFINQLTHYFTVKGKARRNPETNRLEGGDPNYFQQLFWEHCITEQESHQGEYITPMRYDPGSNFGVTVPTAATLSMDGSTSGWRCDVLDFDDPVSDRNSETGTLLEKLDNRIAMISELVMKNGFIHRVATRYQPDDPYGKLAESHSIVELYGDHERDGLKYMGRPCWWLKGQPYIQPDYSSGCPKESALDFFYPDGLSYKELKKKFKKPQVFFSQQLNDPQRSGGLQFTDELIRPCLVDYSALPKAGMIFCSWDPAATSKQTSDNTCGVAGLIDDQRRWWIIDIINARLNFSERVFQIVKMIQQHHPRRTCVEDVHGLQEFMREPLFRQAKLTKTVLDIDWVHTGIGVAGSKYTRMSALHPWFAEKRIFILNTIEHVDELLRQFRNIRPGKSNSLDDIPDAISRLVEQYTRYAAEKMPANTMDDDQKWKDLEEREFHDMIFRKGKYADQPAPVREDPTASLSYAIDELFQ